MSILFQRGDATGELININSLKFDEHIWEVICRNVSWDIIKKHPEWKAYHIYNRIKSKEKSEKQFSLSFCDDFQKKIEQIPKHERYIYIPDDKTISLETINSGKIWNKNTLAFMNGNKINYIYIETHLINFLQNPNFTVKQVLDMYINSKMATSSKRVIVHDDSYSGAFKKQRIN